jgi:DNA transformation protein
MQNDLLHLKNLGNTSVNWLNAVGIQSREDLERLGERGIKVSKVLLYAMQAALLDIHWSELDPALKNRLVQEADQNRSA